MVAGRRSPLSAGPCIDGGAPAGERFRVAVEYAVGGELRYLAHHDELRMLTRALVRAGWPLSYSRGYNPRPRLSVPLPRNVGISAARQVAVVDLSCAREPSDLHDSLAGELPGGCHPRRVVAPAPRGTPHAQRISYELDIEPPDADLVASRIARLRAAPAWPVQREYGPGRPTREIDLRPYLDELELDGCQLRMWLRCLEQRSARPSEVITELGLAAEDYNHRLRRGDVQWDIEIRGPDAGPEAHERK